MTTGLLDRVQGRLAPTGAPDPGGLWREAGRLDLRGRRLRLRADTVVQRHEAPDGTISYVLKNPGRWSFVRLSRDEYELARILDGERKVEECAAYLLEELDIFPFFLIGPCIGKLYAGGFLEGTPPPVFQTIGRRLEERRWRSRLHRFLVRTVSVRGLDPWFSAAFSGFARILYGRPALVALHAVALAGLILYGGLLAGGEFDLLEFPGGFLVEAPLVATALLGLLLAHEIGHALTVKWRGRQVDRGGVSLAVFVPSSFFVDTSDMWLEPSRRGRIAVIWGGPLASLLGSALAAAGAHLAGDPTSLAASVLFKVATVNYLLCFLNLNPLLRTDGYDALTEWLGIPALAERARRFARDDLFRKLRDRERLTRVETFLAAYAGLAALWGLVAIAISLALLAAFYGLVERLWDRGGALLHVVLVALAVALTLPLMYAIYGLAEAAAIRLFRELLRRGFLHQTRRVLALLAAIAALLVLPATALHVSGIALVEPGSFEVYLSLAGAAASLVAAGTWRRVLGHRWYSPFFRLLTFYAALYGAGALAEAVALGMGGERTAFAIRAGISPALGALAIAATSWLRVHHLPLARPEGLWRIAQALGAPASLLAVVPVVYLGAPLGPAWLAPLAFGALASSLAAWQYLESFAFHREGRFRAAFLLLLGGFALLALASIGGVVGPGTAAGAAAKWVGTIGVLFLAGSSLLLLRVLGDVRLERRTDPPDLLRDEGLKLRRALSLFVESALQATEDYFGASRARRIERDLNGLLVPRAYGILVVGGKVRDELAGATTILERGEIYGEVVSTLLDLLARATGRRFTDRIVKNVYDSLFWDERELVTSYLFRGRRWDVLEEVVPEARTRDPVAFLRRVPLFYEFPDAALDVLHRAFRVRTFRPGEEIVRAGETGRELFVVESGFVDVYDEDRNRVNSISAFGFFGERALIEDRPRNATVVARTGATCLVLDREHFDRLVRPALGEDVPLIHAVQEVDLLRRMPIFQHLGTDGLADLLHRCEKKSFEPGEQLIRQGDIGREFYILLDGEVVVSAVDAEGRTTTLARRTRGDSFGEIALLHQIPRTASVDAATRVEVLVLTRAEFERFLENNERIHRFSSQRLATVQHLLGKSPILAAGAGPESA